MTELAVPTGSEEDRWALRICTSWQKSVEGILETGQLLIDAKEALRHGTFEIMVRSKLPFSSATVRKLMAVASNPALADRSQWNVLPASWTTLYQLSKLDGKELQAGFSDGLIGPDLQRKDLPGLFAKIRRSLGRRFGSRRPPKRKTFFVDFKRHFSRESVAWLDGIEPDLRRGLIERLEQIVLEAIRNG